jgi:hypothetical protein
LKHPLESCGPVAVAFLSDQRVKRALVVSLDAAPRRLQGGITVLPWKELCRRLWAGDPGV